jgi:hypothetical protein
MRFALIASTLEWKISSEAGGDDMFMFMFMVLIIGGGAKGS